MRRGDTGTVKLNKVFKLDSEVVKWLVKKSFTIVCLGTEYPVFFRGRVHWEEGYWLCIQDDVAILKENGVYWVCYEPDERVV